MVFAFATLNAQILVRTRVLRETIAGQRGVDRLNRLLSVKNAQLQYEAAFCLWSFTLSEETVEVIERIGAVRALAAVLRASTAPQKVLRVVVAALKVCGGYHTRCMVVGRHDI